MKPNLVIFRAIPIIAMSSGEDLATIRERLERTGLSPAETAEVLDFLPLALGRVLLEGMGVQLEEFYIRIDDTGQERMRKPLMDEPMYRTAKSLAPRVMAMFGQDTFSAVALRSSEMQAMNAALHAGASPENLQASPPVMTWTEGMTTNSRPWWKFWESR